MRFLWILAFFTLSSAALAAGDAAAESGSASSDTLAAIACVPADAEVVAYLDFRRAARSPFAVQFFDKYVKERDKKRLADLESSLGLNAKEDITALVGFGSATAPDRATVGAVGRFQPDRIIARAAATEGYTSMKADGETIHCLGGGEKRYFAFPRGGLMLLGNDLAALQKGIAAEKAGDPTFKNLVSKYMDAAEGRTALAWVYARNPDLSMIPLAGVLTQATADYLTCTAFEEGDGLTLEGRTRIHEPGLTEQVISQFEAFLAVTRLAARDSEWARALSDVRVAQGADPNTVQVRVHEDRAELESMLAKGKKRRAKERRVGSGSDRATSPSASPTESSGSIEDAMRDLEKKR